MALIKCSNCNHEISDTIKKCIHCGAKVQKQSQVSNKIEQTKDVSFIENKTFTEKPKIKKTSKNKGKPINKTKKKLILQKTKLKYKKIIVSIIAICITIIILIPILSYLFRNNNIEKKTTKYKVYESLINECPSGYEEYNSNQCMKKHNEAKVTYSCENKNDTLNMNDKLCTGRTVRIVDTTPYDGYCPFTLENGVCKDIQRYFYSPDENYVCDVGELLDVENKKYCIEIVEATKKCPDGYIKEEEQCYKWNEEE